jgi:hypothetical protein
MIFVDKKNMATMEFVGARYARKNHVSKYNIPDKLLTTFLKNGNYGVGRYATVSKT